MAEGATVANAYVQIMPSAQGAKESITDAIMPGMEGVGVEAGQSITGGLISTLKSMAGPIAGAIAALGIGRMLLDIGTGFDSMRDSIIVGTGASGAALDELCGIAEDVATTVPVSFEQAGDYIQDLNTRLGITGDDLRDVATQLGALQSMLGGVNVETLSGAFSAWGTAAEDMSAEMDYLFSVSQATGISFDSLTSILETSAPAMQGLGFSFEETANMAGLLDQAGMDASSTMNRMNRALVELAGEGGDAGEAFNSLLDEMQGYIDAGDRASALQLAEQLFGTRGAAQFVAAVESGSLAIDDLRDSALGAGDGIMGTYEATASWSEKLDVLKNKAAAALEPLASGLFDAIGEGIDVVTQAFDEMMPALEPLMEALGNLFETIMPGVQAAIDTVLPIVKDLGTIFLDTATNVVNAVTDILNKVGPTFDKVLSKATEIWEGIKSAIEDPIGKARDFVKTAIDKIKGFFEFKFEWPHIPLPHFSISGSINPIDWITGGSLPSISVEWYAKGGIIDGASLIGAGERGAELVWPSYSPYIEKYADALAASMDGGGTVNNYYIDGNLVAADAALAAALDTVAQRVNGRARMGTAR